MLKVLQLGKYYYPFMGGIENHLDNLCRGLDGKVSVEVLVSNDRNETVTELVGGVKVTRVRRVAEISSTPICPSMPARLSASSYDILHVHVPNPTGVMAYLASRRKGPKLVVTYHSDIVKQRLLKLVHAPFEARFLGRADRIIATSPNYVATSQVLRRYQDKCVVIPYGIDPDLASRADEAKVEELRARHGPRFLLSCGRLVYYKGFEYIIEAMRSIEARLVIVGRGPLQSKLEEMIRRWSLAGKVTLLGEVKNWDMVNYFAACDVFVLPSVTRSEAFAIVQLEAMAQAKPVVNTALDSGVPFVSLDGISGVTVPPRDAGALAAAIRDLLADPERMRRLGRAGRERFEKEFARPAMVERILALYRDVTGGR